MILADENLSAAEDNEFHLVVENAKAEGWLGRDDALCAIHQEASVLVQCSRGGRVVRQVQYPRDGRWPYALLRDLAHGVWRGEH